MRQASHFQEAYRATLVAIRDGGSSVPSVADPTSVGSGFGKAQRPTRELVADSFCISNPRNRLLNIKARRTSAVFLAANTIWTIGGGHDVGMISAYNPRGRAFAQDGSYFEASFGIRLFASGHQLRHAERRLRMDAATRRATAVIYIPEDTIVDRLDVPCALTLQFLIRNNRLQCLTIMRSQSAAMVLPYDVFLFTMIQEILAVRLGLELGPHLHFAASMHYYEEEQELVDAILSDDIASPPLQMPPMTDASDRMLEEVAQAEQYLRHSRRIGRNGNVPSLEGFVLDDYWREFLRPLVADTAEPTALHGSWWAAL